MKKLFAAIFALILIIICFSIFYVNMHSDTEISPQTTLDGVFRRTGASMVSSEIYFWSELDEQEYSLERLRDVAGAFSGTLGLDSSALSRSIVENDYIQTIELNGTDSAGRQVNINLQQERMPGSTGERFISVSIMDNMPDTGLEEIREAVLQVFGVYGLKPRVYSCITGTFDGRLDDESIAGIHAGVLEAAGARKIEGISDRNLISVSAYSPMMGEPVMAGGEKVNLNLAIRYNSFEDKTYIWLGTPVIAVEY